MDSGTLEHVIVCVPRDPAAGPSVAPCGDLAGVAQQPVMTQAYVLKVESKSYIDAVTQPIDFGFAAQVWTFVFVFVVGLYLVSANAGVVISMVRGR